MVKKGPMDRSVGIEEQALLHRVARTPNVAVGELAGPLKVERGWGRSTVQKMMDRLVAKGWLSRSKVGGVYRYRSIRSEVEIDAEVLRQFVQARFDGRLSPLVAYLDGGAQLSEEELARLREIVKQWESAS